MMCINALLEIAERLSRTVDELSPLERYWEAARLPVDRGVRRTDREREVKLLRLHKSSQILGTGLTDAATGERAVSFWAQQLPDF